MDGDQPNDDVPDSLTAVSFTHNTVWQRIAIVLAGPLMNFFFAILIFGVVSFMGVERRAPIFGDITPMSVAWNAGLRSGDTVQTINGQPVATFEAIAEHLGKNIGQISVVVYYFFTDVFGIIDFG